MSNSEQMDFEISFYENIVKEKPDHIDALVALGDAYTKIGRYKEGLAVDLKLSKLKPDDPVVRYNLACSYSRLKTADLCLKSLKKAIKLGYRDFSFMRDDPDLEFIRKDPEYKDLLSKYLKETG